MPHKTQEMARTISYIYRVREVLHDSEVLIGYRTRGGMRDAGRRKEVKN
jgi:hypothetical protein